MLKISVKKYPLSDDYWEITTECNNIWIWSNWLDIGFDLLTRVSFFVCQKNFYSKKNNFPAEHPNTDH